MKNFDVIIIGAGPSGACAAAKLLQHNLRVLVLEKLEFPRFVIGESLLPQCMDYLKDLDLLDAVESQHFQIKTGAKFYNDEEVCEFKFNEKYTEGFGHTFQVKRAIFDKVLIDEVIKRGAVVKFNSEVTNFTTENGVRQITYKDAEGKVIIENTSFVIDASGYGRVLPRLLDLNIPSSLKPKGAIYSHLSDKNKPDGAEDNIYVHAINDENAWIWSIPFSDDTASFGIVGDVDFIKKHESNDYESFYKLIQTLPIIKERFSNSEVKIAPRTLMNYSSSVKTMYGDGFVLCGNSTEFLDPIFSSGVTLAIVSGHTAATLVIKELNNEKVDWQKEYVDVMNYGISVFRSYVNAWYKGDLKKIFFIPDIRSDYKKQICSVLAGYVWDKSNPFVKKHKSILSSIASFLEKKD